MPAPFTVFNPPTGKPVATFDASGDLYLAGEVTTGGAESNDGQTIQPGTPAGSGSAGGGYYVYESSGSYPLRDTVTSSQTATVTWVGPDAPTIGSGYAVNGVDLWIPTSS